MSELTAIARGRGLRARFIVAALVVAACAAPVGTPARSAAPTIGIPEGWVTVSTAGAELQLTLPPWLLVSDNVNSIFANEPPAPGSSEIRMQLMAVPPGIDAEGGPGEDVVGWIDSGLDDVRKGVPVVTEVNLPAGAAVRYERLDRTGTPTAWHILAYAVRTTPGIAFLVIDGQPDAWPAHTADVDRIPFLLRIP